MKKLIAIVFVMLIVPSIGYTTEERKPLPAYREISKFIMPEAEYAVRVLCIDGHKFVYLNDIQFDKRRGIKGNTIANSIVQMFEERGGKSLPAKC